MSLSNGGDVNIMANIINESRSGINHITEDDVTFNNSKGLSQRQDTAKVETPKVPHLFFQRTVTFKNEDEEGFKTGLNTIKRDQEEYYGKFIKIGSDVRLDGVGRYRNNQSNSSFEGNFSGGNINGFGVEKWEDGSIYIGEYKDGSKNGIGTLKFDDGSIYQGEFKDNDICGIGSFSKADGSVQKGCFKRNKLTGYVIITLPDDKVYEGEYVKDKKEGFGILYDCNKQRAYVGTWMNSKMEGEGCVIENNTVKKYIFQNSKRLKLLPNSYETAFDGILDGLIKGNF